MSAVVVELLGGVATTLLAGVSFFTRGTNGFLSTGAGAGLTAASRSFHMLRATDVMLVVLLLLKNLRVEQKGNRIVHF